MPPVKTSRTVKQRSSRSESLMESRRGVKATPKRAVATTKRRATNSKATKPAKSAKTAAGKGVFTLVGIRRASNLLKQVSDPTRLHILLMLDDSEHNVGAICDELGGQSQPAVSHHLAKLRDGRLIEPRREGKNNVYALTEEGALLAHTVKSLTWLNKA